MVTAAPSSARTRFRLTTQAGNAPELRGIRDSVVASGVAGGAERRRTRSPREAGRKDTAAWEMPERLSQQEGSTPSPRLRPVLVASSDTVVLRRVMGRFDVQ